MNDMDIVLHSTWLTPLNFLVGVAVMVIIGAIFFKDKKDK